MGCGASAPAAPETIIPDPGPQEQCVCSIYAANLLGGDYTIYQGEEKFVQRKWFFLNKTGNVMSGSGQVLLENFKRGGNPEKPEQGEVLWSAQFNDRPTFQKFHKAPTNTYDPFRSGFFEQPQIGERPDEDYFKAAPWGMRDGGWRRVMKWSVYQEALIKSGTRGDGRSFLLKVFITGTSICDYDRIEDPDAEKKWKREEAEFVDTAEFQLADMQSGQPVAQWWFPGDLVGNADLEQSTPLFHMKLTGGWFQMRPVLSTAADWDPTLAMLIAYFCLYEYSPWAVKGDLKNEFPSEPMGWPGY